MHVLLHSNDHLHDLPVHHFHFKRVFGSFNCHHGHDASPCSLLRFWKVFRLPLQDLLPYLSKGLQTQTQNTQMVQRKWIPISDLPVHDSYGPTRTSSDTP